MSEVIDLANASEEVRALIGRVRDEPIVFVEGDRKVAVLSPSESTDGPTQPAKFGAMKGRLTILAEDDEHLEGFREYMP